MGDASWMNRRRFLAAVTGAIAATAGCSSGGTTGAGGPEPDARTERGYAGPTVTATTDGASTDPQPTTAVEVTATETVTFTSPPTDTAVPAAGGSGGGGGSGPSGPTASAPTATPDDSAQEAPIHLSLSTVNAQRVAGELTCTAGPLAWMAVEIEFRRDGEQVAAERLRKEAPETGAHLPFDVAGEEDGLDSVKITTAYAYPDG